MSGKYCSGASSSKKRKQPDEDEVVFKNGLLGEEPIENEYEHLDEDDEVDDEKTLNKSKAEYESILKNQKAATITRDGDIKITPFNLQEELEEGEIDGAGNYVFSKRSPRDEEENDNWAASVDWDAIEKREMEKEKLEVQEKVEEPNYRNQDEPAQNIFDKTSCYKQMLRIMRPDETVQNTIRRLGKNIPKRRPINRSRQQNRPMDVDEKAEEIAEAKSKLDLMIELAHQRLEDGDMNIYQKNYELLEETINCDANSE